MNYDSIIAIIIFIGTLFLIIIRPKGMNIALGALIGAIAALLFGIVSLFNAYTALTNIWDAALAFIGNRDIIRDIGCYGILSLGGSSNCENGSRKWY